MGMFFADIVYDYDGIDVLEEGFFMLYTLLLYSSTLDKYYGL